MYRLLIKVIIISILVIFSGIGIGSIVEKNINSTHEVVELSTPTVKANTPTIAYTSSPKINSDMHLIIEENLPTITPTIQYKRFIPNSIVSLVYNCQIDYYNEILAARDASSKSISDSMDCFGQKTSEQKCDELCKSISNTWDRNQCEKKCTQPLFDECQNLYKTSERNKEFQNLIDKYCYELR